VRTLACSGAECAVSSDGQQFLGRNWLRRACSWDLDCALRENLVGYSGWKDVRYRAAADPGLGRADPCCYRRGRLRPRDAGARLWAASCFRSVLVPVRGPGVRGTLRSCRRRSSTRYHR